MNDSKLALLIVDHGSHNPAAHASLIKVAELVQQRAPQISVRIAHLELAAPNIAEALQQCAADGIGEIVIHPYLLAPGRHVQQDIPAAVAAALKPYPDIRWRLTEALGVHPLLASIILERAGLPGNGEAPHPDQNWK
ncbi:MAG: CbiX/SirB N-terminal domain-containing protein [Leptospirales bacterium]|nr:CbiX/SirB N-terminal domain-containing protein [Leptospirales bacterium]